MVVFENTQCAVCNDRAGPEAEDTLGPSAGHMVKILMLKEMHGVITKFLLLLLLIVIVDQVSCTTVEGSEKCR